MKVVFIAGPLTTGGDCTKENIERNVKIALEYTIALAKERVGFFCAHTHTTHENGHGGITAPEQFYYDMDFEILKKVADAVLAIPDWEKSVGAKKEVEWAKQNNKKIFYPKNQSDLKEVIEWAKA